MITMQEAFIMNNAIVKVGDVFAYDASMNGCGVTNEYVVVLRAPMDLKRSSNVFGVKLLREKPEDESKLICLDNGKEGCRYIDCKETVSVNSYRLCVNVGHVNEHCLDTIYEMLSL